MLFREEISNANDDAMRLESIGSLDETATGRFNPTVSSMDIDSAPGARESELFSGQADVFAFERCVSRLVEMSTWYHFFSCFCYVTQMTRVSLECGLDYDANSNTNARTQVLKRMRTCPM